MTNLEVAAIVTVPSWLVCIQLWQQDRLRAWHRRWRVNRMLRQMRRADSRASSEHRARQRMVGGAQ